MGFRIHRGIFQKLNAERTAYENTFKIDADGRIKEVDSDGNVTAGYLKVGEQASDADTVDGLHSDSFIRSDASNNVSGHTEWQDNYQIRLGAGADLRIWHDGNNHVFRSYHHGANYYFQLEDNEGTNRNAIIIQGDTSRSYVRLYEDGAERFRTTSAGVEVLGETKTTNGVRIVSSGGYGIVRGYDNDNHFIVIRGSVSTGTSTLTITGAHKTTFVEHANDANEGWYFVSKASGNYTEMARIDGVGQMYIGGNKVWHQGNDGSNTGLDADKLDGLHSTSFIRTSVLSEAQAGNLITSLGVSGMPYTCDIILNGDPNTFYPVHFFGGDQNIWRRIIISRNYSWQAPPDWYTATHRGGLLLDWEGNFGGWGGATYSDRLRVFNESYSNMVADMYRTTHSMGYTFFLRGGGDTGAQYRIFSDQPIRGRHQTGTPDIAYDTSFFFYTHSNTNYNYPAPAPLRLDQINRSRIDGLKTMKVSEMDNRYQASGSYLTTAGKAADANLLDGINSTSFLRSDANDTFTGTITMGKQHALVANNYGRGVYGTYDSRRYQHVWSMGTAYNLADDGTTAGNLYGIAWTHQNIGGESISGLGHQMLIMSNGDTRSAIGDGIWTKYNIYASGGNSTEWNAAYDWGNHADAGYAPSSHNHNKITENTTISFGQGSLQWTDLSGNGGDGLNGNTPENPFSDWHHHIIQNHSNSGGYYVDIASSFHHDRVHFRRMTNGTKSSWREFWHTGNLSTTKVSNWDTAYGWGDHSTQGYLDTVPEEYKTQTQNDARYAAIAHNHSGVYDPAGTAQSVSDDLEPRITAVETLASRNETGLQSKANLSGSYGQDFNVNNLRSDQWLRNTVSGKGLYNEATTQHWYSDGDDYWNIAGGGSFNAIRFRDDHGGTQRGLVGADNSNRIGFLDAGGHWAVRHNNDNGTYFYTDNETLEFRVGRDAVTGNYGTVQTETTRSSWGGYSIDGRVVFMHDHGNWWGIYNDVNNEWMIRGELNGRVELRHNSATKLETTSSGVTVTGTVTATSFAGDGSALTGISNTPPVTTSATNAEASTLASIDFNTDENIATFTLADGTSYTLQMLRPR